MNSYKILQIVLFEKVGSCFAVLCIRILMFLDLPDPNPSKSNKQKTAVCAVSVIIQIMPT
jgi:hypothetical protein